MKEIVATFFDDYAKRFNEALQGSKPDVEKTVASFASCFVESNPNNIICNKNDETFKAAIPQGFDYYRSVGLQNMKICSKAITIIDDYHAMVKIHWQSLYVKQAGNKEEIGFDVHYFVQVKDNAVRIFAYVTGDEKKLLEERGLVPYK